VSLVLLNPRAAGGRAARLHGPIAAWLRVHRPGARLEAPARIDDATALVERSPRGGRVVLVGGDGTVHRLLPALLEGACELGLVPAGSGNDTARALGVAGMRPAAALALALEGAARPWDVGECAFAGRRVLFASSLAAGFDAAVGLRALRGPAWLTGQPRYLWATLREIAALRAWTLRVRLDGEVAHAGPALFASVLNTPTYGAGLRAVPSARADDGRLDALVAGRFGRAGALAMLPRLMAGTHLGHRAVLSRGVAEMIVDSEDPVPLAGDGEPAGHARSWRVRVLPGALQAVAGAPVAVYYPPTEPDPRRQAR
jgi:diacylglycerol kinase (ATP)